MNQRRTLMSSTSLPRAVLVAFSTALVLVAVSTAQAAGTVVEGVGDVRAVGLAGTNAVYVRPTQIPEAAAATAAAVGPERSFVLTPEGVLASGVGNLGLGGGYDEAPTFTPIAGTAGAKAVATGFDSTLILRGDGTVDAFGDGLAAGPGAPYTPTPIAGIDHVTAIAVGAAHAITLKSDGSVWAWGSASSLGNSAVTADTGTPVPVALPAGSFATAIATGGAQSLALLQDGSVWGWGPNNDGEVGNGSKTTVAEPVEVIPAPAAGAPRVTAISAGSSSSFARYDDGSFRAGGRNTSGQLGLGNGGLDVTVPTAPDPAVVTAHPDRYPPLASISSASATTYAIARDGGRVYGWGANSGALLGFGDGAATYDFAFPYTGAAGSDPGQAATEIPQRVGRLKGAAWLGVGGNGLVQVVAAVPTLTAGLNGPLPFFSQAVGTVSARVVAPIQSRDDPTTVTSVKVTGPDEGDFEVVRYNKTGVGADVEQLPLALAADQYLSVYVRFTPSALGERNATLQVSGDGETASIPLLGFGTALPGNTPGTKGDAVIGPVGLTGPAGPAGPAGAAGAAGKAGKDGVVTFTTKKATTTVKRGRATTLSFTIKNATAGRLLATTATATLPRTLVAKGGRAIVVRALAPGASRTVSLKVTAGRRVAPGVYTVKLRVPYGSRAVTATARVKVAR
jgi:alpha-tubulin suppressor-like RCC1 family protein